MKRFLIVFLFLLLPFSLPKITYSQSVTPAATTTTTNSQPNWWNQFWSWVFGLFVKTDYIIGSSQVPNDMTEYGDNNNPDELDDKRSFAGSRSTDAYNQNCFKGSVIKKVILNTFGYPDSQLAEICMDSTDQNKCLVKPIKSGCTSISISDLANYFVQINKQFYCNSNNKLIETEEPIKNKVSGDIIAENQLSCYQQIYDDLYLTPKDSQDQNEENTRKMIQTPISNDVQDPNSSNNDVKNQLDQNFSPDGTSAGLSGLRPENDK